MAIGDGAMVDVNGCLTGRVNGEEAMVDGNGGEFKKPLLSSDFFQKAVGLETGADFGVTVVFVTLLLL